MPPLSLHRVISVLAAAALAAFAVDAAAQSAWPGASCHSMATIPNRGVVVFGGARFCGTELVSDSALWLWDGRAWSTLPGAFPSRREDALLAYDTRRRVLVLYGGRSRTEVYADTWEWNGTAWTRRQHEGASPGPLEHAAGAFDSARGRVVVFGGGTRDGRKHARTWDWDGATWQLRSESGPAARVGHSMAYSRTHSAVVMYGGFDDNGSFTDLWRWSGNDWQRLSTDGPTHTEGMALVATDSAVLVVGVGKQDAPPWQSQVSAWRWTTHGWLRLPGSGPPGRVGQGVAYDYARRRLVLIGGAVPNSEPSADVWEYDGTTWHRFERR